MIRGIESVGVVFLIFAAGYFLHRRKLWPDSAPEALSNIVFRISAPCLAVTSIVSGWDRETLAGSLVMLIIAALHLFALMLLGKATSRLLSLSGGRKTIYEINFTFSNVIFIGLPINQIVFGEIGVPVLFMYFIVSVSSFWSFGSYQIAREAQSVSGEGAGSSISAVKILNPGLVGVLAGIALVQAQIALPPIVGPALGYLANLTVPLSLLVIGANLTMFSKGVPRIAGDEVFVMFAKFAISPLIMFALLKLFAVSGLPFYVFLLSSSMPCHMQSSIIAKHYGVEPAYASKLVGLSTLLSIVTIPCYVAIIHGIMA
jgi:predicted permease